MGVSIALIAVAYVWFDHIGPSFSANRMIDQQVQLRKQYVLPSEKPVPKERLEVPPSF